MKKETIVYIIYISMVCLLTAYFSLKILQEKMNISLTGRFFASSKNATSMDIGWTLRELEKYVKIPTDLKITERYEHERYNRNSEGFKDYEHDIIKPNNTIRILALGDSFTEGVFVRINYTWPKQLERKLNQLNSLMHYEVLNLGRGGAGTLEEVELFEEKGIKYNPDIVILLYYENDWEDSLWIRKRANELWEKYKNGDFKFPEVVEKKIKELNASEGDVSRLIMEIAIEEFWRSAEQRGYDKVWEENVEKPLIHLIDICKKHNIKLMVVAIDLFHNWPLNQQKLLNNLLSNYNIPFIDLSSYFPEEDKELRLPDNHLSEKGYDLLSDKILEFMLKSSLIS